MASRKPETHIVNSIQTWVNDHNGNILKLHGNAMQRRGEPDLIGGIIVLVEGKEITLHFAVETKLPGEDATPLQKHRLAEWEKVGFRSAVVHSLDEFIRKIDGWARREVLMNFVEDVLEQWGHSHD